MKVFAVLLLVAAALPAAAAGARPVLDDGARVRVTVLAKGQPSIVGTLLAFDADSLGIAAEPDSSDTTIARLDIRKFELHAGRKSGAGTGFLIGAVLGGASGAYIGALAAGLSDGQTDPAIAGIVGGAVGAVAVGSLGALIGSAFHHDKWTEVKP